LAQKAGNLLILPYITFHHLDSKGSLISSMREKLHIWCRSL